MCGIVAAVNFASPPTSDVSKMVTLIRHRGPDAQDTYRNGPVHFGHARLRVMDLDPRADQPFLSNDGRFVVVFNGEIYNFREIRLELTEYRFCTECDTEVIVAAYAKWGTSCIDRFNGMFAFVIFDRQKELIFAARDRMGVKPLYFASIGYETVFSSEIKAIAYAIGRVVPNYVAIAEYLEVDHCEHRADTFFEGISQLLPGELLLLSRHGSKKQRYYDLKDKVRPDESLSPDSAARDVWKLLRSSVTYRVQSDVPVALYFSGGIDSSALAAALMASNGESRMRSLTAISSDVSDVQRDLIKRMGEMLGLAVKFCDSELGDERTALPRLMWHTEMPFVAGILCDDSLNRAARDENIVVVLEGQGSDEFQAGYLKYYLLSMADALLSWDLKIFIKGLWRPPLPLSVTNLSRKLLLYFVSQWIKKRLLYRKRKPWRRYAGPLLQNVKLYSNPAVQQPFQSLLLNAMYRDAYTKLQRVLRYKDRISMAYGRELRVPFLDFRLIEYMLAVPDRLKLQPGILKCVLKNAIQNHVPQELIQMPKNVLLKKKVSEKTMQSLQDEAEAILASGSSRNRGVFDINSVFLDSKAGTLSFDVLWKMSQVELWHQVFVDRSWQDDGNCAGFSDVSSASG